MSSYNRGQEIVRALEQINVRATVDPSAANPPVVLVVPPTRRFDLACGYTAEFTLVALAPGAFGADRSTWDTLDTLVDSVATVVDLERAELVSYTLNGVTMPAYLLTFSESIS